MLGIPCEREGYLEREPLIFETWNTEIVWLMHWKLFSVKILEKRHIIREKKVPYVSREKDVLSRLSHPFFVQLYFTFQDKERLCILLDLVLLVTFGSTIVMFEC